MRNRGFTLIELITVIIILGVLAATALPMFVNLKADARLAKMQGTLAAAQSEYNMLLAKWAASGSPSTFTLPDGRTITFVNGAPDLYSMATSIILRGGVSSSTFSASLCGGNGMVGSSDSFIYGYVRQSNSSFAYFLDRSPNGGATYNIDCVSPGGECGFAYIPPTSNGAGPTWDTSKLTAASCSN